MKTPMEISDLKNKLIIAPVEEVKSSEISDNTSKRRFELIFNSVSSPSVTVEESN